MLGIKSDALTNLCKSDELNVCCRATVSISKMSTWLLMGEIWTTDTSTKDVTNNIHSTTTIYRIKIPLLSYIM